MRKFVRLTALVASGLLAMACVQHDPDTLDGSTESAFADSMTRLSKPLPTETKRAFVDAIVAVYVDFARKAGDTPTDLNKQRREALDGLTVAQVIARAKDLPRPDYTAVTVPAPPAPPAPKPKP